MKILILSLLCCLSAALFTACGPQEPPRITVTGIVLDKVKATLTEGETTTLVPTVTPADATDKSVRWSSSNQAVATVTDGGVVSALHAGTAVITATTNDGGITATCTVTVDIAMAAITGEASHISCRNATLSGKANLPANTSTDLKIGVLYSTSQGIIWGSSSVIEASAFDSEFNYSVETGVLEPETTYYYRSYILQNNEVTYGDTKSFTTLPVSSMIETAEATEIEAAVATLHGKLDLTDCRYEALEYGFKLTPQGGEAVTLKASNLQENAFSVKSEGLTKQKPYDVSAYVILDGRTYEGEKKTFSTESVRANIDLNEVTDITEFKATVSGKLTVESQGSFSKSAKLYYSSTESTLKSLVTSGAAKDLILNTSDGSFSQTLTALNPGTTYSYAVIATVDGETFASEVKNFSTASIGVSVVAKNATDITEFKATLNGKLTVNSIEDLSKSVWFYYSATSSDAASLKSSGTRIASTLSNTGTFSGSLQGLSYNTTYYYIACAMVNGQEYTSEVKNFTTANYSVVVKANDVTGITEFKATLNGKLTVKSIEDLSKSVCFYYSTTALDAATLKSSGTRLSPELSSDGSFSSALTGLSCNTIYYYIACAMVNGQEYTSEVKNFTTSNYSVVVKANDVTGITEFKATLNGTLTVNSIEDLSKSVWFYYSATSSDAASLKSSGIRVASTLSNSGTFSGSLQGLSYNTTYYYIACAMVNGQEYTSEVKNFTTANYSVAIAANDATGITEFRATLSGTLTVNSIDNLSKSVHFYYSTTESDVITLKSKGTKVLSSTLTSSGTFTRSIAGLTSNTTYYYIACAMVNGQEYTSDVKSFTTANSPASVVTNDATDITEFKATLNGTLTVNSLENLSKSVCFYYSTTALDAATLKSSGTRLFPELSSDGSFSSALTGLSYNTTYYYIACAIVNGQEFTSEVRSFKTANYSVAVAANDATGITEFKATLNGTLTVNSLENLSKNVCFYYSTTALDAATLKSSGTRLFPELSSDGSFSSALTGLSYNTMYCYIACATVNGQEYTSEVKSFKTANYSVAIAANDATGITEFRATLSGTLTVNSIEDLSKSVWFYYSATSSDAASLKSSGIRTASTHSKSGTISKSLQGLSYNTTYYYIACATVNGQEYTSEVKSFKTANFTACVTTLDASEAPYVTQLNGSLSVTSIDSLSKEVWFLYSETAMTVDALRIAGRKVSSSLSGESFAARITFKNETVYYYVACAKVHDRTIYGAVKTFTVSAVDMGLSVKWASFNVGAEKPEDYGDYYAWGETTTKSTFRTYSWSTYTLCGGSSSTMTKYCTKSSYGTVDNKTVLDPEDDVAHVKLGGKWRMPTDAEWTELRDTNNCDWAWTAINGIKGMLVTSKKTGNSIFLPAAGDRYDDNLSNAGSYGYYWSSSLSTGSSSSAWSVDFHSGNVRRNSSNRYTGQSVRPVSE